MKLLFAVLSPIVLLFLAGCALGPDGQPSGEFKSPQKMTPAEACFNATQVVAALDQTTAPTLYPSVYSKAVTVRDEICKAAAAAGVE